ncbi:MAG: tripartite tricarboxylate transporter TctB family protein [Acetobacterales bacterium]
MNEDRLVRSTNWGHVAFATFLLVLCLGYLWESASKSTDTENLLLVLPATGLAALLYLILLFQELRARRSADEAMEAPAPFTWSKLKTPAIMFLFGLYMLGLTYAGFDIPTFLFIAGALAVQGERRPLIVFGYPAVFTVIVVWGMQKLLPFPIPTLLL